jgi:hypothetical protein
LLQRRRAGSLDGKGAFGALQFTQCQSELHVAPCGRSWNPAPGRRQIAVDPLGPAVTRPDGVLAP